MEGDKVDNVLWSGVRRAPRVIAPFQVTDHDILHSAAEAKISINLVQTWTTGTILGTFRIRHRNALRVAFDGSRCSLPARLEAHAGRADWRRMGEVGKELGIHC